MSAYTIPGIYLYTPPSPIQNLEGGGGGGGGERGYGLMVTFYLSVHSEDVGQCAQVYVVFMVENMYKHVYVDTITLQICRF